MTSQEGHCHGYRWDPDLRAAEPITVDQDLAQEKVGSDLFQVSDCRKFCR